MNNKDARKEPMGVSKRKADVEANMELCLLSAFDANSFNASDDATIASSSKTQPIGDPKRGKLTHVVSEVSEKTKSFKMESTEVNDNDNDNDNDNETGGKCSVSPEHLQSRLQWLQNHNIMHNVMSYLDEINLFHLENAHSEMIGTSSIARQWSYLSSCDDDKTNYIHKRWRPMNETDAKCLKDEQQSTKANIISSQEQKIRCKDRTCDLTTMRDSTSKDDLLARCIGRNFAEEAIFVREREKEASRIYDFDRTPVDPYDIPMLGIDLAKSNWRENWCEWYDYRANSVNGKNAFVRLSLRDGSGRFWHGFRGLTTNYNTTFFRMQFNMRDLIQDMKWTEFESYLQFTDATYTSMQKRLKAMESIMRMIQLTVSVSGKLLVATGGCCSRFSEFSSTAGVEKCYFHPRHYRLPLADTTKNAIQWMPYRICVATDPAKNELAIEFDCDHADLPFMKAEDIGKPHACAHW